VTTLVTLLVFFALIVAGTWPAARCRRSGASGSMTYLAVFFGQLVLVEIAFVIQMLGVPDSWQILGGIAMFAAMPVVAITALVATPIVCALVPEGDDWA
jgi:hypothetical protein